jgi:hypothetical protein
MSAYATTKGLSQILTPDLQSPGVKPAVYGTNDKPHDVLGYVVFAHTFHRRAVRFFLEKRLVVGTLVVTA